MALLILSCLLFGSVTQIPLPNLLPTVHAMPVDDPPAAIAPSNKTWGPFFGTSGDVQIDVNRTGIAVRVEIPREFLQGVISGENDTSFIQSNIRNDYYYYSVVDESAHWTYAWRGDAPYHNQTSDGPCFKPRFSLRDPNAPWCVEIWNYLNGTFRTFTPPKFIRFRGLNAPAVAGTYNFTLFVANQTNAIGYPDFVHAWNTTLFVPVSMRDSPASISGTICDSWFSPSCPVIFGTKGIVYARDSSNRIVARSYVNETTGQFNITGLAPGTYNILASAGYNATFNTAYSLTEYNSPVSVLSPGSHAIIAIPLNRAPQVCGEIAYSRNGLPVAHALSDHPYLPSVGLTALNITVEAQDPNFPDRTYRNLTVSTDGGGDSFRLVMGSNVTYVGTDPYGTEFAGLPPATPGSPYVLNVNVWISGYVQSNLDGSPESVSVTISNADSPLPGSSTLCKGVSPNPVVMRVQPAITGTLQFTSSLSLLTLESPHQAEASLPLSKVTDALFGGNVLIQAYDHLGILRGVSVINGTYANRTTIYKDSTSIPFIIYGFNEYFNHTWSGVWDEHDNGLPLDSGYSLQVYIRGYELQTSTSISVGQGCPPLITSPKCTLDAGGLRMVRGGAFQVGVFSYDNRFGTRATQSLLPFLFLNVSIPVRGRVYFYDSAGIDVGYVECILRTSVPQPDPLCHMGTSHGLAVDRAFTVIFAGQNWSLREIWFYGDVPTHVRDDTYTIKTYTLGYVWQHGPIQAQNTLAGFSQAAVSLLIGVAIDITGPVFEDTSILGHLPENDYAIGEAFLGGGLSGAIPSNLTAGTPTLILPDFGFGGMTNSTGRLEGQGHFFYVTPDGTLRFDYGLDNATYTAQVPEFGFDRHFTQIVSPAIITFSDLFLETGVVMSELPMAIVTSTSVTGCSAPSDTTVPLSWVQVTASNGTYQRSVPTLDGQYGGPGALNLPEGTYNITFSVAFFASQTINNLFVQWGSTNPGTPSNPLNPTAGWATCDPPANLAQSHVSNAPTGNSAHTSMRGFLAEAIPHFNPIVLTTGLQFLIQTPSPAATNPAEANPLALRVIEQLGARSHA